MGENMASCHGSEELSKGKDSKRGYPSLVEDPSPGQKSKLQRVGDYNEYFENSSEQILPRFSPNSVLLVSLAGQVVGAVENKAERKPKGETACHKLTPDANVKNALKRKRDSMVESFSVDKESSISSLRSELNGLFKYFDEVSDQKMTLDREERVEGKMNKFSNSTVACLLEESRLPFSKLVEQIFDKLNKNGYGDSAEITLSAVRSSVLFVGQRSMYGIPKADTDVLEDESKTCLWCWEVRDLKLLPKLQRGTINIRRICRRKIHDRIMAVSALISSLSAPENQANYKSDLMKAAERIVRVSDEEEIRAFANGLIQRHSVLEEEKEAKLKEKALIKEMEQNKRMVEKEQKRLEKELRKEQLRNEKELKRQLDITAKEEKQREKGEAETQKQLRRHQEEVEKDQKRRVKQEAELKKQLAIKKQASIMERFLKRNVNSTSDQSSKALPEPVPFVHNEGVFNEVVSSMDQTLSQADNLSSSELLKLHLVVWKGQACSASHNKSKHWSVRHRPKVELIKELRLQRTSCVAGPSGKVVDPTRHACSNIDDADELNIEKLVDGWEEAVLSNDPTRSTMTTSSTNMRVLGTKKKLFQFDKSHRPAYYGTMSRRSDAVSPRHPLRKDPNLDYEIDSDEEWEEEDPGENLSDFDKDDEEGNLESDENPKAEDEDESEDGFVVPDGYLSENEGVHGDVLELDNSDDESEISTARKAEAERGDVNALLKQQKYLSRLTDHALGKNQPLIILNLMHEKDVLMTAEVNGTQRLEQICLQALSIRPMTEGISIDITSNRERCEDTCSTPNMQGNDSNLAAVATSLQESDLPEIVSSIQSHSQGINKVIESLQKKFPSVPKVQLRNKVKEISDFLDNRWQVKKGILDKLGISASPENRFMRSKGIATFFKKRCLPPEGEFASNMGATLQPCDRTDTVLGNPCPVSDTL